MADYLAAFEDLPVLDELGAALTSAWTEAERTDKPIGPRRRRGGWRGTAIAIAIAVVVATGALAATDVIHFGTPVKSNHAFSNPHRGAGAILPHSVRLLPISTPDPQGGPAWGMRVLSTTRGVGCIQVGRLLDGRLGILGRDHAFGNDRRFHEMPANSSFSPGGCTALDANGRIFLTVGVDYMPASGMQSCYMLRFFSGGPPPGPGCKLSSVRTLSYGLLGPEATGVTYRVGGRTLHQRTVGPEGAYLIVIPAIRQSQSDSVRPSLLPWGGPVTAIDYRDGSRCNLPLRGHPNPATACKPHGYAPLKTEVPTRKDLATRVTARLVRTHTHGRRPVVQVAFKARVGVKSARNAYVVTWSRANQPRTSYVLMTQGDIRAGTEIRKRFVVRKRGLYRGTVRYVASKGPEALLAQRNGSGVLVGTFAIRVR